MWIILALVSAVFLGFYDIAKKYSVNENAVIPVLLLSSLTSALIFTPIIILSHLGVIAPGTLFHVPQGNWELHLLAFIKSAIVGSSWFFAYMALKHLPITIVTPIRATGPVWTLMGALVIFGERYTHWQWIGLITVFAFFYYFSIAGKKEGISFKRNKWVWFIILATLIGAASGLYDKYLMQHHDRMFIQSWFSIYLVVIYLPFLLFNWYPNRKTRFPFQWRWSIPMIGILLSIADFAYFYALTDKSSLIAIVSVLRRTSVIYSFGLGAILFKEKNLKSKTIALLGILVGVLMIVLGSSS